MGMDITALGGAIGAANAYTKNAIGGLWDKWSSVSSYAKGQIVLYNNTPYQANTATTAGTWVASEWTQINISDSLEKVDSALKEPSSGMAAGKYFKINSIDSDGHPVLECVDGVGSAWGGITGTLANQTDLQTALDLKANIADVIYPRIIVTAPTGSTVTVTKGSKTYTATEVSGTWTFRVTEYGTYSVNASKGSESKTGTVNVTAIKDYTKTITYGAIYGVTWDGTSSTSWTRTDAAANFSDPVPYIAGASSYSSPFDDIMPWSGMVRSTDSVAGEVVAIPKFYYKLTHNGNAISLQITESDTAGFSVSPAHRARTSEEEDRDVVYIGRYHCSTTDYKSTSGVLPKASITRSAARTAIHNLGTTIWQNDWAMRMTLWMLYLVEFANWNSQDKIGYGCGNNSSTEAMGYTDDMPYHTGTMQTSRSSYGLGTQYRYIEGLWDNVYDWCDGCYYDSDGLNIIMDPSQFSDSSYGTNVGSLTSGYPSQLELSTVEDYDWCILPKASSGSTSTYTCDRWYFDASNPCLRVGGIYGQSANYGLFHVFCSGSSHTYGDIGSRLQILP